MRGILDHKGRGLCESKRRGPSVCWLGGGGRVDVGINWCGGFSVDFVS